jgi:hypothetical protein
MGQAVEYRVLKDGFGYARWRAAQRKLFVFSDMLLSGGVGSSFETIGFVRRSIEHLYRLSGLGLRAFREKLIIGPTGQKNHHAIRTRRFRNTAFSVVQATENGDTPICSGKRRFGQRFLSPTDIAKTLE